MFDYSLLIQLKEYIGYHIYNQRPSILKEVRQNDSYYDCFPHFELENYIKENKKEAFNRVLFNFIDKKGLCDSEVYKKAGLDRRHFSKIRSNSAYRLSKNSVIALSLALELEKEETDRLLCAAGFSFSDNDIFDLVIQFCVDKKIFNIDDVNQALDHYNLKPLAGTCD
ncbi:UNVERIFIED_CONTAM: hypothetical protein Cloal_3325 [Acetivibrio alkalicellulosi]